MTRAPSPTRSHRTRNITIAIVVFGLLLLAAILLRRGGNESATPNSAPSHQSAVCRAEGKFIAGFLSPQADAKQTGAMLERMNTDAITFGGRIEPVKADNYPDPVAEAIGSRQAYRYTVEMAWQDKELTSADEQLEVDETTYGIIAADDDSVVVTQSVDAADPFDALLRAASSNGNKAYIGLPVPNMRTSGETWLPDNSYADVVDSFSQRFVRAYADRGADGFYLAMEMPLTDEAHWDPVTEYYDRQTQLINTIDDGATVLVSPYLEGRKDRQTIAPKTAALGYEKLLGLANGTNLLVSPQDGLGVGTTALETDDSEDHQVTVEDYFETLHEVNPDHLYVTVEAMRPGGGSSDTRESTSRNRVEEQLDATEPFVRGAIGYQWSGSNAMMDIAHIGYGACAAGPNQLP